MADTTEPFIPQDVPIITNSSGLPPFSVASLTFIIWNWLLMLDEEVTYIWLQCGRLSWIRWVYFFNRYVAILVQSALFYQRMNSKPNTFSAPMCHAWFTLRLLAPPIFVISVQTILVARVRALYHRSIVLVRIVYCAFIIEVIMLLCGALMISHFLELGPICFPRHLVAARNFYLLLNTPPFLFEVAIFILTFYKAIRLSRDVGGTRYAPLLQQVLKDGTWAFLLLCLTFFANQLTALIAAGPNAFALVDWLVAIISFTSSRLILNMLEFNPTAPTDRAHRPLQTSSRISPGDTGRTRELADRAPMTTHVELEMGAFTQHYDDPTSTVTRDKRVLKAC